MLLLEVSTIDPGELRRYAEIYRGEAEIFLRDDGKGALVLCNGPVAAGNSEANITPPFCIPSIKSRNCAAPTKS